MDANPRATGAPRWAWAAMWLMAGAAATAVAIVILQHDDSSAPAPSSPAPQRRDLTDQPSAGEVRRVPRKRATPLDSEDKPPGGVVAAPVDAPVDASPLERLREEAKALAAQSGTTPRQGLAKYAEAEDFIRKAMLDAKQAKSANFEPYQELYKNLLTESDEYSKRVITQEFMESIPWTDLLDGDVASKWSRTTTIPGIEDGVLTVSPPDSGVCGILDQKNDNLRHFMLEVEFEVDGVATMFFHVSPPPQSPDNRQSETFDLSSKEGGLKPNERYSMVATYIGSDLTISFPQDQKIERWENSPAWTKLRRGGIAFLIPEGTRLRITRMRIRVLR
jgi:hypothetical protein